MIRKINCEYKNDYVKNSNGARLRSFSLLFMYIILPIWKFYFSIFFIFLLPFKSKLCAFASSKRRFDINWKIEQLPQTVLLLESFRYIAYRNRQ